MALLGLLGLRWLLGGLDRLWCGVDGHHRLHGQSRVRWKLLDVSSIFGATSRGTDVLDIGVPPYLAGSSLVLIMAQRLVRRICSDCKDSLNSCCHQCRCDNESASCTYTACYKACGQTNSNRNNK